MRLTVTTWHEIAPSLPSALLPLAPPLHRCFFALALMRASKVGLRIGELSSWKGLRSVCRCRKRGSATQDGEQGASRTLT